MERWGWCCLEWGSGLICGRNGVEYYVNGLKDMIDCGIRLGQIWIRAGLGLGLRLRLQPHWVKIRATDRVRVKARNKARARVGDRAKSGFRKSHSVPISQQVNGFSRNREIPEGLGCYPQFLALISSALSSLCSSCILYTDDT